MPTRCGPCEPLRVVLGEQKQKRERARDGEFTEIAGYRDRLEHVAALDRALKLPVQ